MNSFETGEEKKRKEEEERGGRKGFRPRAGYRTATGGSPEPATAKGTLGGAEILWGFGRPWQRQVAG
ncbi:hypothetical protein V6Z11_A11G226000 [Gossypium hirsutum]